MYHFCFSPCISLRTFWRVHEEIGVSNQQQFLHKTLELRSPAVMLCCCHPKRLRHKNIFKKNHWKPQKVLPSLKLTDPTWKWMVGRRSFPFGMAYFQVRTVSFRECALLVFEQHPKKTNTPFFFAYLRCSPFDLHMFSKWAKRVGQQPPFSHLKNTGLAEIYQFAHTERD